MALVTAEYVRLNWLPELSGSGEDTRLGVLIDMAGQMLATWCGVPEGADGTAPSLESATRTYYSTPGQIWVDGLSLWLPIKPITSITSIYDDESLLYPASSLVSSGDYALGDAGEIRLSTQAAHGGWSRTNRAVKVTAVAGYTTVPGMLKAACAQLVAHLYHLPQQGNASNRSQRGASVGFNSRELPAHVKELAAPYRSTLWVGA